MNNEHARKGYVRGIVVIVGFLISVLACFSMRASAATDVSGLKTNMNASFVGWSPNMKGWTVDIPLPSGEGNNIGAGVTHSYWYSKATTVVETGVPLSLPVAGTGQHVYPYDREGVIPINRWEIVWEKAACIHDNTDESWFGLPPVERPCGGAYYSGWNGFCADCGGKLGDYNMYMSIDYIKQLQGIDNRYEFYYVCPDPDCGNLEQQSDIWKHKCEAVSYNQYKVEYKNNDVTGCSGDVNDTLHMYNNATEYRGAPVTECSNRLSTNEHGFVKKGYRVIGWSLTPGDPYGTPDFSLGQKLTTNLSEDDWNVGKEEGTGAGVVTLYAVWSKVEGSLTVKPGTTAEIAKGAVYNDGGVTGRTYNNSTKSTNITGVYLDSYVLNTSKLTAPTMGTVTFDTKGGSYIAPMTVKCTFKSWEKTRPFYGTFSDTLNKYAFTCLTDGISDVITATWKDTTITLPEPTKTGQVFGGWYEDSACTKPVGAGGAPYTPRGDVTIYAKWSQLVLYSETDPTVDGGKGGVDLTWRQDDSREKFYKIYQKKEGVASWTQIFGAGDVGGSGLWSGGKVEKNDAGTGYATIPATGFYTIDIYGAQGSDYGIKSGGKGGHVTAKFWLTEGDTITYSVGARTDGGSGGVGANGAAGGGATVVTSAQLGTLAVAGGGGGASWYQNGGAGGLTSGLVVGSNGASGAGGGGDGYSGGAGGSVIMHSHVSTCKHSHSGDAVTGGGCYVLTACGGTYVQTKEAEIGYYKNNPHYDNKQFSDNWDYEADRCKQCWKKPCEGGHPVVISPAEYTCNRCNRKVTTAVSGTCTQTKWNLGCGKTTGQILCGFTESDVVSADPSYGGSNYINTMAATSAESSGTRSGAGYLKITLNEVGYFDDVRLDNVSAHDEAKPDRIDVSRVTIEAAEGTFVEVGYEKPADNGTVYYHYAESYLASNRTSILSTTQASPTINNITTGVKKYYYILDTNRGTNVTASNKQGSTTANSVKVLVNMDVTQWFHVAAVDAAGNIGDSVHIEIKPDEIPWNILTEQVNVSSVVGGTDYGSVYPAGSNTYYVRADGRTPFTMSFRSYVQGTADKDYQVDNVMLELVTTGIGTQMFHTTLPKSDETVAGTVALTTSNFVRSSGGASIIADAGNTGASRYSYALGCNFAQTFTGYASMSGNTAVVTPRAGASYVNVDGQNDVNWSDSATDGANKATIIFDGEGPLIYGMELLDDKELINRNDGTLILQVTASDSLSGVGEFYLLISNLDNGNHKKYTPEADGSIRVELTRDEPVFNGDFQVLAYAVDRVGNESSINCGTTEFALYTKVERILEPHEPVFACGESGILSITAYGYADRVEVIFPEELTALNPQLNCVFDYTEEATYIQAEQIQFMIPLKTPANTGYTITVRAYKGDKKLEEHPSLSTIAVEGDILKQLRTRLR